MIIRFFSPPTDDDVRVLRVELEGCDLERTREDKHGVDGMLVIVVPENDNELMRLHVVDHSILE